MKKRRMENRGQSCSQIYEPGISPPKYDPQSIKGSNLHKQMLSVAFPNYMRPFFLSSTVKCLVKKVSRLFDKYYLLRYRNFISQPHCILKLVNYIIYLVEHNRVEAVHYAPFFVNMDISNICNLRCPGCITGLRHPSSRKMSKAELPTIKRVVDKVAKRSIQIGFLQWGEPLLNDSFYAACAYATEKGLWTLIHSNLNIRDDKLARKIVDAGLHRLIVSCDGATQEVYEKYRIGGDVELVFENIQRISSERKKRELNFPWITAKFTVFDHNWHEIELFKQRALAVGADEVLFAPAVMGGFYKTGRIATAELFNLKELRWEKRRDIRCNEIWNSFFITCDGGVYPCCASFRDADIFVSPQNSVSMELTEQWNIGKFKSIRSFFLGRSRMPLEQLPQPCNTCRICSDFRSLKQKSNCIRT